MKDEKYNMGKWRHNKPYIFKKKMNLINKISNKIDMFIYRLFFYRWNFIFSNNPKSIVPLFQQLNEYLHYNLSKEEIEEELKKWEAFKSEYIKKL